MLAHSCVERHSGRCVAARVSLPSFRDRSDRDARSFSTGKRPKSRTLSGRVSKRTMICSVSDSDFGALVWSVCTKRIDRPRTTQLHCETCLLLASLAPPAAANTGASARNASQTASRLPLSSARRGLRRSSAARAVAAEPLSSCCERPSVASLLADAADERQASGCACDSASSRKYRFQTAAS